MKQGFPVEYWNDNGNNGDKPKKILKGCAENETEFFFQAGQQSVGIESPDFYMQEVPDCSTRDSFNVPEIDITYARTLMQNMGYGIGLDLYDDAGWEASTFLSYNFSYIIGNLNSENTYYLFQNTFCLHTHYLMCN